MNGVKHEATSQPIFVVLLFLGIIYYLMSQIINEIKYEIVTYFELVTGTNGCVDS